MMTILGWKGGSFHPWRQLSSGLENTKAQVTTQIAHPHVRAEQVPGVEVFHPSTPNEVWVATWPAGLPVTPRELLHDTEAEAEATARRLVRDGVREVVVYARCAPVDGGGL